MNELFRPDDTRDALRKIGALLFGIGVLMLLLRKATIAGDYSRGVILLILLVPAGNETFDRKLVRKQALLALAPPAAS